jgi:hypothetical protein
MGRDFWTPLRKPSKLAPFMTMLGGLWKTIAEHTAAKAGTVPTFHLSGKNLAGIVKNLRHFLLPRIG